MRQDVRRVRSVGFAIRRWCQKPGSFFIVVCLTLLGIQSLNLISYLHSGNPLALVLPSSTQLLSLTIGTIFILRALQLIGSVAWTLIAPPAPLPLSYTEDDTDLPGVTVQIAMRNEALDVVAEHCIRSAFALNYPAKRLEIQIIDNSDSSEHYLAIRRHVESMAGQQPQGRRVSLSFVHRAGTEGYKARNLNLGLACASGSYFLILDADSTVPPDTLLAVLPYFRDPKLAYAQLELHAVNEDTNVITRGAAMLARSRSRQWQIRDSQGFVGFDGHNGIVRREALQVVEGWSEVLSEDAATAIKMRLAGFHGRYVPIPSGELVPDRFPELMKQRWRWTLGTAQLLRDQAGAILRCRHIPWFERFDLISFLCSLPIEGLGFILLFTFVPLPPATVLIMLALWFIPSLVAEQFHFRRAFVRHLSVLFVFSAVMPTTAHAVLQSFSRKARQFWVTGKGDVRPLSLPSLLRVNAFGMLSAVLFFAIALLRSRTPAELLTSYLGASIVMGSALAAPFALNYSKWLLGNRRKADPMAAMNLTATPLQPADKGK